MPERRGERVSCTSAGHPRRPRGALRASWVILVAGGVWVSAVLVLFPIALQVGFVFIGGARRLLDVRQMKELFPRVVSGFAVGFLVGGLLGIPLLPCSARPRTCSSPRPWRSLPRAPARDRAALPGSAATDVGDAPAGARPPLRTPFVSGLALLPSRTRCCPRWGRVVDFLLFDWAAARYSADELTRFLSTYTAVLNLVDILFLALLA